VGDEKVRRREGDGGIIIRLSVEINVDEDEQPVKSWRWLVGKCGGGRSTREKDCRTTR